MKVIQWLLVVAVIVGLGWYAKPYILPPANQLSEGDRVDIRAVGWLEAMVIGDWAASYQYTSPGYQSGVTELEHTNRMATRRVQWLGGEVIGHDCEQDVCNVKIRVVYKVNHPMRGLNEYEGVQVVKENWIKTEGDWWLVPEA